MFEEFLSHFGVLPFLQMSRARHGRGSRFGAQYGTLVNGNMD